MGAEQRPGASRQLRLGLYVIPDAEIGRGSLVEQTEAALAGGANVIQLRAKHLSTPALLEVGAPIQAAARAARALFIVNDRVDVALALAAGGVHIGDDDQPVAIVRRRGGQAMIVGATAGTPDVARTAWEEGADYLGVGPVFPTASKADAGAAI